MTNPIVDQVFHFEQPFWFLGLLVILPVAFWLMRSAARAARGPIHRYADPHLLPHLSGTRDLRTTERWGRFLRWSLLWTLLLTAMAGPRWDSTDVRLFHPGNNLLVLLDISRSMLAQDVSPSRLGRARQELQDLIARDQQVRLGLIVFASTPHVLSPITEDIGSLLNTLPALSADLASPNLQGSSLTRALDRAESLLAGLPEDSARAILLISDGDFDEPGLTERVARLAEKGVRLHALGMGTTDGASVPAPQGGFILDPADPDRQPVRSRLNEAQLEALAQFGGGLYRRADYRDADTDAILKAAAVSRLPPEASDTRTRIWNERYWLPVLLVAGLLLPRFRRLPRRQGARRQTRGDLSS
ncbi:VWA domain-containing protein [Thiocystis violascens]|uniref:RNA polymerase II transcription initiation/nucleotide excision repair factor TFIIH, subunit SSL1 n=1 Tax=Thiocystis violascens (strain ATCC 17096 / DSM 198 / 6111) TaxID=765911 RepID=I3YAK1_THIV6|nr:RNA polymerase II transcription initiation/nucleotide excision repair factor TFIIH, subunit SSL1 [Thiocystis violascens DSM 198]